MKNLIFSKKYLKTKLGILTLIVTVAYHYLNKDKSLYDGMKQGMDSDLKNESKKNEELIGYTLDDEYTAKFHADESHYDDNDAIIPSEWILEYWNSIRNRKPAINIPKLSQGIISDSKIKKLDLSEFLESQIVQDVVKALKEKKYFKENQMNKIALGLDVVEFCGLSFSGLNTYMNNIMMFGDKITTKGADFAQNWASRFKNGVSYLYNGFMRMFTTSANTETNADQIEKNETQLNSLQNNIVRQDGNNNTVLVNTHNDTNNNTMLNTFHNDVVNNDTNNNTMLNDNLNDENIFEPMKGGFMVKIGMFFSQSYENMKTKLYQMSGLVSSKFIENATNTSAEAIDPPVNA